VLRTLVEALQELGAGRITLGDRSGMGSTRTVLEQRGVFRMADELGFEAIALDELGASDWEKRQVESSHLDGVEALVEGGPAHGTRVDAGVVLAGTDRVAIDAVGVAILRYYGATNAVERGAIFEQQQIARAVELGLGVDAAARIELVTDRPESAAYADEIWQVLLQG